MKLFILLVIAIINTTIIGNETVPYQFKDISVENKIGTTISKNIILTDEYDTKINLHNLVSNKPTIINFVYLNCPLLCHLLLDGLLDIIKESSYKINNDYQIISISIDPKETNENLTNYKNKYLNSLNINQGWHFLKGTKEEISKITKELGYNYNYIKRTNDYAHPSVIYFYNNKITNYIEGVTFDVDMFNYSVISNKENKTIKEKIITYCYFFDPDNQTYSLYIMNIMRLACLLTVLIISMFILRIYLKERDRGQYT